MPGLFGKAGYRTGIFGKWHLGDSYPHRPIDRGFQESVYHLGWGQLNSTPEFDMPLIDGRYFHNGAEKRYKGHCTDFWFDSAMAWMKKCKENGEPFFCYLPTNAPHAPHIDLEEYIKPYRKQGLPAGFFGMIAHVDRRFGVLEKFLVGEKLKDDTIVVFMTDNGGTAGMRVFNAGLRAGKTTYYDGGHRVPCWVRWPGAKLGEPRDVGVPTQNTDLLPTLCELCGVERPKGSPADELFRGVSLAGLLRGTQKELADRKLVVQYGQIIKKFDSCVIWGKWRLVKGEELYDVEADRAQKTNLADKHPEVVKAMRDHYEAWWKAVEPMVGDFVPISIGAKQQPVVELTSGDWEGIYADNTGHVREAVGGPTGGHWHIQVERPGEYEFTLRRWPAQTKAALGARYEPRAGQPAAKAKVKTRAFPSIASAKVSIDGNEAQTKADPNSTGASLSVTLPAGRVRLKAWFTDADGKGLCGAFFVTVRRKG
jgi:arylsulfatase